MGSPCARNVLGCAEEREDEEREEGCVEAVDGRQAGEGGEGEALRDEHEGDGRAGNEVAEQVGAGVVRKPPRRRDVVADALAPSYWDAKGTRARGP